MACLPAGHRRHRSSINREGTPPFSSTPSTTFGYSSKHSVGDGIYWAITTMTTVGYGDITPKTTEGKVIAVSVMLVGIGFATLIIGAIAERFTTTVIHDVELTEEDLLEQVRDISSRLQHLERTLQQRRADNPPAGPPRT